MLSCLTRVRIDHVPLRSPLKSAHVSIRTISKWFPSLWVSIILYLANPNVGTWQHSNWCKFCSSAFDVADFFHAKMTSEPCHAPAHRCTVTKIRAPIQLCARLQPTTSTALLHRSLHCTTMVHLRQQRKLRTGSVVIVCSNRPASAALLLLMCHPISCRSFENHFALKKPRKCVSFLHPSCQVVSVPVLSVNELPTRVYCLPVSMVRRTSVLMNHAEDS